MNEQIAFTVKVFEDGDEVESNFIVTKSSTAQEGASLKTFDHVSMGLYFYFYFRCSKICHSDRL